MQWTGYPVSQKPSFKHRSTFPILCFDQSRFEEPWSWKDVKRTRNSFCIFEDSTLLRFYNQGLTIKQLQLRVDLYYDIQFACPLIDADCVITDYMTCPQLKVIDADCVIMDYMEQVNLKTDVFRDFSIPSLSIRHLHVSLCSSYKEKYCFPLVTCLLWSCRPSIISCGLRSRSRTFIKSRGSIYSTPSSFQLSVKCLKQQVLCEKVMSRKEEECFCSCSHIKCWWHGLKDVKVISSSGTRNWRK